MKNVRLLLGEFLGFQGAIVKDLGPMLENQEGSVFGLVRLLNGRSSQFCGRTSNTTVQSLKIVSKRVLSEPPRMAGEGE
jgi:hypothetical protein